MEIRRGLHELTLKDEQTTQSSPYGIINKKYKMLKTKNVTKNVKKILKPLERKENTGKIIVQVLYHNLVDAFT